MESHLTLNDLEAIHSLILSNIPFEDEEDQVLWRAILERVENEYTYKLKNRPMIAG